MQRAVNIPRPVAALMLTARQPLFVYRTYVNEQKQTAALLQFPNNVAPQDSPAD